MSNVSFSAAAIPDTAFMQHFTQLLHAITYLLGILVALFGGSVALKENQVRRHLAQREALSAGGSASASFAARSGSDTSTDAARAVSAQRSDKNQ